MFSPPLYSPAARPSFHSGCRAFTLIELLTVIAIIGILAAIIIPVVGKVRRTAQGAQCVSNMRQLGSAMLAFSNDNKGRVFGDVFDLQSPTYDGDSRRIQYRLYSYLSIPAPKWGQTGYATIMRCDGWRNGIENQNAPSIWMRTTIYTGRGVLVGGQEVAPFGNGAPASSTAAPLGILLGSIDSPSREWAMTETDTSLSRLATSAWRSFVPQEPVHGAYHNAVFFDGHVGKLDVTTNAPL